MTTEHKGNQMKQRANSKYGLTSMDLGQKKRFSYEDHSKIRLACHFTGKRYGRKYTTHVVNVSKNKKMVEVERIL